MKVQGQSINFEFGSLGCGSPSWAGKAVEISGEKAAPPPPAPSLPTPPPTKRRHIKLFITFQLKLIQHCNLRFVKGKSSNVSALLSQQQDNVDVMPISRNGATSALVFCSENSYRSSGTRFGQHLSLFASQYINLKYGQVTRGDA